MFLSGNLELHSQEQNQFWNLCVVAYSVPGWFSTSFFFMTFPESCGICSFIWGNYTSVGLPCPTLCDPMDCSTPGFLVHHQLLELA